MLKTHLDCEVASEMLTGDMLKENQCSTDGGFIASKMLEIERKSKFQFECTHVKNSKYDEEVNTSK